MLFKQSFVSDGLLKRCSLEEKSFVKDALQREKDALRSSKSELRDSWAGIALAYLSRHVIVARSTTQTADRIAAIRTVIKNVI